MGVKSFCLSQDLGRMGDWHGQVLTETTPRIRSRTKFARGYGEEATEDVIFPDIVVRWMSRTQSTYDKLVDETREKLNSVLLLENCWHVVDATGVGIPTIDFMRRQGLNPVGVWITGGHNSNPQDYGYSVPKVELVNTLQLAFNSGYIKFARGLDKDAMTQFQHEYKNFKMKPSGKTEAWREDDHDDLVMALALNVWWVMKTVGVNIVPAKRDEYRDRLLFGL